MVRLEWLSRSAARDGLQNWRLHFLKTAVFEESTDFAHHGDAFGKVFTRLLVRNKIEITLAIARLDIL